MNKYRNILKESNPSFLSFSFGAFRFFLWHDFVLKNYQSVFRHFFSRAIPRPLFSSTQPIHPVTATPPFLCSSSLLFNLFSDPRINGKCQGGINTHPKDFTEICLEPPLAKAKNFFNFFSKTP